MKIKITEIEANPEDLRASQTLGTAVSNALRNAFSDDSYSRRQSNKNGLCSVRGEKE